MFNIYILPIILINKDEDIINIVNILLKWNQYYHKNIDKYYITILDTK